MISMMLRLVFPPRRGTDKTNITRKPSKTGKHEHGNQKSTKEAKDSKPKPRKVNYGQASVKESKEAQEKLGFALIDLIKEAHMSLSRIAKLAIRVSSIVIQGP
ncbi:hypothetical protein Tco_1028240 [Tanacetum coccineum]|uniref:Uncharacterized protein n=1 Tax=Tanacetum coccineum TaxID=301880 RepID=A0ABQ5G0E7_9ASTR